MIKLLLSRGSSIYTDNLKMFILDYRNLYSTCRDNVPFTYHLPVVSSQIIWLKMINDKIETPMKFFLVALIVFQNYYSVYLYIYSLSFYRVRAQTCGGEM